MKITTIGLDIAKRMFQAHGVDASGKAVLRRKLQRSEVLTFFGALPPCLVGIEACGTAHHWAREIKALGHEAADARQLREALRQARQDRCGRRRGDLRGGDAANDALRAGEVG
jgi:transposase